MYARFKFTFSWLAALCLQTAACFFTTATGTGAAAETSALPHLVVFLADDYSYLDSEALGATDIRTPNLSRLAAAGMSFTHAFVASPSCAPSRAALLTGLMPARNGAEANHSKPRADLKKLPAYLKELGYEVVSFGKVSHYKHTADYGFDHFEHDTFHDPEGIPSALRWLRARDSKSTKPLCIFIGSNWPHVPWPKPAPWADPAKVQLSPTQVDTAETREARAAYATAIFRMDDELGQVMAVTQQTLGSNIALMMTSDHGAQFPFGKWNCYDAGTRVPLIASWPGKIAPASSTDAMVSWIDILPTLVELGGGKAPTDLDGQSFAPILLGKEQEHRDRIFTTHSSDGKMNNYPMRSVRTKEWKLIINLTPEAKYTTHIDLAPKNNQPGNWSACWPSWVKAAETHPDIAAKVERYHHRPAVELYHLITDPHESHNLAADPNQAGRIKQLREELDTWRHRQGEL